MYDDKGKMYVTGVTSRAPLGTPALCGGGTWYGLPGSEISWIEETYKAWQESSGEEETPSFDFFPDEEENSDEENSGAGVGGGSGNETAPNPAIEYPSGGCTCSVTERKSNSESDGSFLLPLLGLFYALRRREK